MSSACVRLVVGGLAWLAFALARGEALPPRLSVTDATKPPQFVQAEISPDGRHIIGLANSSRGTVVVLIDTQGLERKVIVSGGWERDGGYLFSRYPRQLSWITSSIFAVNYGAVASSHDLSGKRLADIGSHLLTKTAPADPQSTMVLSYDDPKLRTLAEYDARNGRGHKLSYPMAGELMDWALDAKGRLRVLTLANSEVWNDRTRLSHWYRGPSTEEWVLLDERPVTDEGWKPIAAAVDSDELTVLSREGRSTWAIFRYDAVRRERGEMLAGDAEVDISYAIGTENADARQRRLFKTGLRPTEQWMDPRMTALQAAVDAVLPGKINRLSGTDPKGKLLVHSYSDTDPGVWFLLDASTMKMHLTLEAMPAIDPAQMRPMESIRYQAADGLEIPAFLTRPASGPGPWPLVVVVHGGPLVRDAWAWNANTQLLVSRGYAVFQPQFRGSAGFGKAFEQAGYGQWGLAMQDDITAGVQHLISSGIADRRRICIQGASYGGYAAVWGLIKTPDLYRCGISAAGVSDIAQLYSDSSDSTKISREVARFRVGDEQRERARLDAVSPLRHADRIRAPLLLIHGDEDIRVPITHSKRLMKAMDKADRPYEWLLLKNDGHGVSVGNAEMFQNRVLDFIDRHIGPDAGAPP
jgi:dipeptidyl aminopeptidase/acylaminoacyl peptidase